MSATFRLSKNKVSQNDLRRLMNDYKGKTQQPEVKKINNPLAKYNDDGQITCLLCRSVVRSEKVWTIHINSKQHKENVAEAKHLKEQTNNFTEAKSLKRPSEPVISIVPVKKPKGILKNATPIPPPPSTTALTDASKPSQANLPFHNEEIIRGANKKTKKDTFKEKLKSSAVVTEVAGKDASIPEGFFDDPIMDAKARNVDYRDPIEEEWDKFQKEMREETSQSAAIVAGEQEEATAERQIDEIDEQIKNWSRVLDLERKKDETSKQKLQEMNIDADEQSGSEDGDNFDEFLDWRAKMAYR